MSAVSRTKALFEILLDKPVSPALARKIADRYLTVIGIDKTGMTNELKAAAFLNSIKRYIRSHNMSAAIIESQRSNQAAEDTARDNAANDFV